MRCLVVESIKVGKGWCLVGGERAVFGRRVLRRGKGVFGVEVIRWGKCGVW